MADKCKVLIKAWADGEHLSNFTNENIHVHTKMSAFEF